MSTDVSPPAALARGTGLLVIEVTNSNPNGDPDRESDPRQRPDGRGEISPVSFKRKLRDVVENKEGPVWKALASESALEPAEFHVLESRGRVRSEIEAELRNGTFRDKYWDARLFGNTFLEEGGADTVRAGVVQFGLGLSVAPIEVERMTMTNKAGVEADKDRGMAPLAFRVVRHGVYVMPFFVNPNTAHKTGCTKRDIDLMLRLVPHAYDLNKANNRTQVDVRHAWYVEHKHPLGSWSDFAIIAALTPQKKADEHTASTAWADYAVPTALPDDIASRLHSLRDLVYDAYAVRSAGA